MDYEYTPFHREKDFHNRCCDRRLWCIKVNFNFLFIIIVNSELRTPHTQHSLYFLPTNFTKNTLILHHKQYYN